MDFVNYILAQLPGFLIGFFAVLIVLRYLLPFLALIRTPMAIQHILRAEYAPELTPLQRKTVESFKELGFTTTPLPFTLEENEYTYNGCVLQHETLPVCTTVYFRPGYAVGYAVCFESFTRDGIRISTYNFAYGILPAPGVEWMDAKQATRAAHWQAHRERLKERDLITLTAEETLARLITQYDEYLAYQHSKKLFIRTKNGECYYSLQAAWAVTRNIVKTRKLLKRGCLAVENSEPNQSEFFAECYQLQDRIYQKHKKGRPRITWSFLAITFVVSYLVWGWSFDWYFAIALIIILLVHESGHALAMRLFGYRDMSMFFIPMMGAVVTGKIENIATWKQGIVLFAGPVPGIIFGITLMFFAHSEPWDTIASLAVFINLFNLLPMVPLDGGQLMQIALFARWPRITAVFYWLSSLGALGLGLYLQSGVLLYFLAYIMAKLAIHQQRVVSLSRQWHGEKDDPSQLPVLFALARQKVKKKQAFLPQFQLVRAVYKPSSIRKASLGETAFIMVVFLSIWLGCGMVYYHFEYIAKLQHKFDRIYNDYADYDDTTSTEAKITLMKLIDADNRLEPQDPRHIDLIMLKYRQLPDADAAKAYEHMIETHQVGYSFTADYIANYYLTLMRKHYPKGISKQMPDLEKAVAFVEQNTTSKTMLDSTVRAKLWLAEGYDLTDSAKAQGAITALLQQQAAMNDYSYREVLRAQLWFLVDNYKAGEAVTFIQHSSAWPITNQKSTAIALDYGWAQMLAGQPQEGLNYIRLASIPKHKRHLKPGEREPLPLYHIDLAYAYTQNNKIMEALFIIEDSDTYECSYFEPDIYDYSGYGHWQQKRTAAITTMLKRYCPKQEPKR